MIKSYEPETLLDRLFFKVFPAFALIISLISIILPSWFRPLGNPTVHYAWLYQFMHVVSSIIFILILVFPGHYVYYAILGLIFSIYLPYEKADVFYSFIYVILFLASVFKMGFLKDHRKSKTAAVCFFYGLIIVGQLFLHGTSYFLENLFQYLVTLSLIIIAITFVFSVRTISKQSDEEITEQMLEEKQGPKGKYLDLSVYNGLTNREIIIICKILQNEKYDYIARQLGLSEITVKKAAGTIFKKMDCTDKFDFMGKYSQLTVQCGDKVFMSETRQETDLLAEMINTEKSVKMQSC